MTDAVLILFIAFHIFGVLGTVSMIGKERKPITPGVAVVAIVLSGGLISLATFALVNS